MHDAVVLIFADALGNELARKGIARRHGDLFGLPRLADIDADVVVSGGTGRTFTQRLGSAVAQVAHYSRIVIIGRDCPTRGAEDVRRAFDALRTHDTVLGPDGRGGCWLIGLRGADLHKLEGVRWCRGEDCAELLRRSVRPKLLCVRADVDSPADLPQVRPIVTPAAKFVAPQFVVDHWSLPPPSAA